ncbi:MAG TPA: tail fiber protein [Methylomusa anaerophila]|uniref:Phage Tail Collar Domain protein n=1 Tax=Methylomusa anaerophila TaxID=1930071 RepID=A0A348AH30_9FIRM|nr:tail fiber protein [Methylomusa anaerophila]BBB90378.1 phage Tail Collar Domain protein [Methylomusa anaerophila]HML89275.1 tail fiber protein [Methylomusa anaerophila]
MSDWFIGEIRLFSYGLIPRGWTPCDGRLLQVQQNTALFSLIGNYFGGDGRTTFALPDLRGRVAVHPQVADPTRIAFQKMGMTAGGETHQLTISEVPAHTHAAQANTEAGTGYAVAGNVWAAGAAGQNLYGALPASPPQMNGGAVSPQGGGQGHENMQPFLALSYCIATTGLYPQRP